MFGSEDAMTSLVRAIYRKRRPCSLEARKPRLKWFPKYEISIQLPRKVVKSDTPEEELEKILAESGFKIDCWTRESIQLTRGKSWGDFSAKLVKLRLTLPLPLKESSSMKLEAADVCLFDTGDLWELTNELAQRISDARPVKH